MYAHNFIEVSEKLTEEQLERVIEEEIEERVRRKESFCKIKVMEYPKESSFSYKGKVAEKEILGTYLCNLDLAKQWHSIFECDIKRISNQHQLEELIALDLINDAEDYGVSFCKRRAIRRGKVYLDDRGCDSYICYYKGKPVGSCDLFVKDDVAKIEDFTVISEYRRKGIGTTLLKALVEKAQEQGAKIVYLNTDEDETAKEMYVKLGFKKIQESCSLFWDLSSHETKYNHTKLSYL